MTQSSPPIHRLDLMMSNAFLVGEGANRILVDCGADVAYNRLRKGLDRLGVRPGDIKMVLLTHAHPDHAGNARRLQEDFGAKVAVHATEADWLRQGTTELYQPCGFFGHVLNRVMKRTYEPCVPDQVLDGDEKLLLGGAIGALQVLHTPGHTPGHICVEMEHGDLFAGDLMRGGMIKRNFVGGPFFMQDRSQYNASVERVTARAPRCLHFGHGKDASGDALARAALT